MAQNILEHLPLVEEISITLDKVVREGMHVQVPTSDRTKLILSLVVQSVEHVKAAEVLLVNHLPTQALAICRTLVEILALTDGIIQNEEVSKLLEKKSLQNFRKKLSDLKMLDQVTGLDETILSIHPGSTSTLAMDQLLGAFEKRTVGENRKMYYTGYRMLCEYTHPDYLALIQAIEKVDENSSTIRTHNLEDAELPLGLGLMSAVATIMTADSEKSGLQFDPKFADPLEELLYRALDLMAPIEERKH